MQIITRRRLTLVALLLLLAAIGLLFVLRTLLDSEVLRQAAEARLSSALGQPVSIGDVRVTVFPVPAVVGTAVSVGAASTAPELTLERVRILPRVASLLRGPYVIRDVALEGLTVRIVRELPGRWRFPAVVPAPGGDRDSGVIVERVSLTRGRVQVFESTPEGELRATSSIDEVEGQALASASGLRIAPIRGRVGAAAIRGEAALDPREARIEFTIDEIGGDDLDDVLGLAAADAPSFLGLPRPASVSLKIRIDRSKFRLDGTGSMKAPEVRFYSLLAQGLEAAVHTDGAQISFDPAAFTLYGGKHRGRMRVDLSRAPARWTSESEVTAVDVGDFLAGLTGAGQRIDGTASASASLHARVGDPMPDNLGGRMVLDVASGVIREFPLLSAINRTLRLAEGDGRDTRFDRLTGTFRFPGSNQREHAPGGGYVTTGDLVLHAREVRVEAAGRIGFDRSLDLSGLAIISPERSAAAVRSIRELSGLRNDRGELELPLRITGSFDVPSFAIDMEAVIGRSLEQELRRRIRRLFRR